MKAKELMSTQPVVVSGTTPVAAIAELLAERGISAVPVVDEAGTPLGIVTEGDLIRRLADQPPGPLTWFFQIFAASRPLAERFAKARGATARDVMSKNLICVGEEASAERVAQLMERHHIRRVLVVREATLLGIVSRADLLRALLREPPPSAAAAEDDSAIQRALVKAMREQPWVDAYWVYPAISDGVVTFHGFARNAAVREALAVMARDIPGVKGVVDQMAPMPLLLRATL